MLVGTAGYMPPMGSVSEISERLVHARVPGSGRAAKTAFHSTGYARLAASASAILHLPDMQEMIGIARSTIHKRIGAGTFPAPVQRGPRVVAWKKSRSQHGRTH